jgi:hypothetical protein
MTAKDVTYVLLVLAMATSQWCQLGEGSLQHQAAEQILLSTGLLIHINKPEAASSGLNRSHPVGDDAVGTQIDQAQGGCFVVHGVAQGAQTRFMLLKTQTPFTRCGCTPRRHNPARRRLAASRPGSVVRSR